MHLHKGSFILSGGVLMDWVDIFSLLWRHSLL